MYSYKNDSIYYKMSNCFTILHGYIYHLCCCQCHQYHKNIQQRIKENDKLQEITQKEHEIIINIDEILNNNNNRDKTINTKYFIREEDDFEIV